MVSLTSNPIDLKSVIDGVMTSESGGVDLFVGTTRNHAGKRGVKLLEYEAYEPMAVAIMERLELEARRRWPVNRIVMVHRLGKVPVGEASVAVAVSSAHRTEAFEACRFLIDTLKREVPIWKREHFTDGTAEWSGAQASGRLTAEAGHE